MAQPLITVIISTYNWSAALRCAIKSVLLQTVQDFELWVVGDCCTDDSEKIVSAFNDARIHWHNLPVNHGSQWGPNNYGLENASAEWVAYLGHDDIWYPTHLEAILRTAEQEKADVITSVMLLFGPPGSRMRGIAGLFGNDTYSTQEFVPPSAVAHRRQIIDAGIKWRPAESVTLPLDVAFLVEMASSGRRFASSNELTCFKYNAAWRRDSYIEKSVFEQEQMLSRIESGRDFRQEELLLTLQAVVANRFVGVGSPPTENVQPGWLVQQNRRRKGLARRYERSSLRPVLQVTRFDMADQNMPFFEWHQLEHHPRLGSFRWSGPGLRSTIDLPILFDRDLALRIFIGLALSPEIVRTMKVFIHSRPIEARIENLPNATYLLHARAVAYPGSQERDFGITLEVARVMRPLDRGINEDRRWLGVAVCWAELEPLTGH